MKGHRFWKIGIFVLVLLFSILFTACGSNSGEDGGVHDEAYVYLAEFSEIPEVTGRIQSTTLHEGRIYFAYVNTEFPDENADDETLEPPVSTIVVGSMMPDGDVISRIEIPNAGTIVDIGGLRVTDEGNVALIFTDSDWARFDTEVIYAEYSPQGTEIHRQEVPNLVPTGATRFDLTQALFMDDGNVALLADVEVGGSFRGIIYLLDEQLSLRHHLYANDANFDMIAAPLGQSRDGDLFLVDIEYCPDLAFRFVLREIDFEAGVFGKTIPLAADRPQSLHPAREDDSFDLLVADQNHLIGFSLETGEQIEMLNWMDSGASFSLHSHLNPLENGQLSVLTGSQLDIGGDSWQTERNLLTRTARADLPVITVGAFCSWTIPHEIREKAAEFNRRSQTHQIEFMSYLSPAAGSSWAVVEAASDRMRMDLMTGEGPDIIVGFIPVGWQRNFLDLYPFLDADPELDRSDFLPRILELMEAQDGSLRLISYTFRIMSIFGMSDRVEDIETWTFAEMRTLVEQALEEEMTYIMTGGQGYEISTESVLRTALQSPDMGFINFETNTAHLDSDDFIELLEFAVRLPRETFEWSRALTSLEAGARRMRNGEQLLHEMNLSGIYMYQAYRETIFGDDMALLGWPSDEGGHHLVDFVFFNVAINAASAHPDAAWEFIRELFMPGVRFCSLGSGRLNELMPGFSVRIDEFDAMIEDAMTPRFERDADGNEVEVPRIASFWDFIDSGVDIYALTEEGAGELRSIMERVTATRHRFGEVFEIISEELLLFRAGDRTAADAARIMQNRVQTLLSEQG